MVWTNPSILRHVFPWILWKGGSDSGDAYLTFDDGPDPAHTPRVLDLLGSEGVHASFFLNGAKVLVSPGIVERILVEGHTVGNHGFTHRRMDWKNGRWVLAEIRRTDETIEKITGRRPVWFRPPYGRFDPRFRRWMLATGHRMALWSLLAGDFLELGPDALVDRIRRCLHQGAIVVLHDGHEKTPDMLKALPGILRAIRSAGLSPGPLPTVSKPMNSPAANTGIPQGNE